MAHPNGRHDPETDLADAKRALLDICGRDRNEPPRRVTHSASTVIRSHPLATMAGAAALGVIVVTQPWLRRLAVKVARKAVVAALMHATK